MLQEFQKHKEKTKRPTRALVLATAAPTRVSTPRPTPVSDPWFPPEDHDYRIASSSPCSHACRLRPGRPPRAPLARRPWPRPRPLSAPPPAPLVRTRPAFPSLDPEWAWTDGVALLLVGVLLQRSRRASRPTSPSWPRRWPSSRRRSSGSRARARTSFSTARTTARTGSSRAGPIRTAFRRAATRSSMNERSRGNLPDFRSV
jgi:hypothetical protein